MGKARHPLVAISLFGGLPFNRIVSDSEAFFKARQNDCSMGHRSSPRERKETMLPNTQAQRPRQPLKLHAPGKPPPLPRSAAAPGSAWSPQECLPTVSPNAPAVETPPEKIAR